MIKFLDLQKITARYQEEIKEAVNRVVDSGWFLLGEELRNFENDFAEYTGVKHCIGVANGLDALRLILQGYIENGGTALQINMIDADLLRDAQKHPDAYRHLLVRVTGYNAYFASIGRELQNEIITRESHNTY